MKTALVIACSMHKTLPARLRMEDMPVGITPKEWQDELLKYRAIARADSLYLGSSFTRLRTLAYRHKLDLFIASAGLGIVPGYRDVPSYEASFAQDSAVRVHNRFDGTHSEWLRQLTRLQGTKLDHDLVLAVVPDAYEEPVAHTLGDNVLFITTRPGPKRAVVYDRRLNDPTSPYRGRDVDFKVRAAEHYFAQVWPGVDVDLSMYDAPARQVRAPMTDAELMSWLNTHQPSSPSGALRMLNDQGFGVYIRRIKRAMGV